jgi:hypothetical protein
MMNLCIVNLRLICFRQLLVIDFRYLYIVGLGLLLNALFADSRFRSVVI